MNRKGYSREEGHFTLEAVIALAIASTILLAVQMIESNAIGRNQRARMALQEALALEQALSCFPRLTIAAKRDAPQNQSGNDPKGCPTRSAGTTPGPGEILRAHAVVLPMRPDDQPLTILSLEFTQ